jgi:hypothetical protein
MRGGSPGWILLGTAFRLHGVPEGVRRDLDALLGGFPPLDRDPDVELRIASGENGLAIDDGETRWDLGEPLSSHLEYRVVNEALRRARDRWVLHAGAVAAPGGTCLLVGESGAGKTSLTLWLWASGLRLVTDDLCPLRHGSLAPEVFPRSLHMDCEYSPRLLARIPPRPEGFPADYYPFPGSAGEAPPIRGLLVIERGPRPEGEIEPLGQSEAAHLLLKAVIKSPAFHFESALEDMLRLSRQVRACRLCSSTPEGAGERALEWVERL